MKLKKRQQGSTLVVAMIFLILMSLFAISTFKGSTGNLRIIGNMQSRQEAIAVGQKAIERTLSTTGFATNPAGVAATPIQVDIDGNGTADYTATLNPQPTCYRTRAIKSNELNAAIAADRSCMKSGSVQQSGLVTPNATANAGDSLCSNSEWKISAQVVDARSGASVVVNQGVAVRVLETDAANSCL